MIKQIGGIIAGILFLAGGTAMALTLTSPAFEEGALIPKKYTCDSEDYSPPLKWTDVPDNTRSFVLIVDDPDAPIGTFDHWLVFNIPADTHELEENLSQLPESTKQGSNSWGKAQYGGPCPPDREHRYFFRLYALDTQLDLPEGTSKEELHQAMEGHILEQTHLMGRYDRH